MKFIFLRSFIISSFFLRHERCIELFDDGTSCKPGFYMDGSNVCQMCDYKCETCVTTSANCATCFGNDVYSLDGTGSCTPAGLLKNILSKKSKIFKLRRHIRK